MFLERFVHEKLPFAVVLDDDGKAAYAYLHENDKIVSDVWLYNCDRRVQADWSDRKQLPFANKEEYVEHDVTVPRLVDGIAIDLNWKLEGDRVVSVDICIVSQHVARLAPNKRPGWSLGARKAGPLARPLSEIVVS